MRAALISIAGQPRGPDRQGPVALVGKTLARRQLDFALAARCEQIIVLGDGSSGEAIALRHVAETAGARFQAIGDGHGLLGAIRATDELLVLAPGLVAEDPAVLTALKGGGGVLVFPAGPAVAAGFERIDSERAWAGALMVHGGAVERLAELPPDIEPAAALLRVALQARLPERRLPEDVLVRGGWAMVSDAGDCAPRDHEWLRRNMPARPRHALAGSIAHLALRRLAARLLTKDRAVELLVAGAALLLAAAVGLSTLELSAAGFLVLASGIVTADFATRLGALRRAPFGTARPAWERALPYAVDAALLACAVLAIDGAWLHRLFAPLALMAALHASRPERWPSYAALAGDRGVLALVLAAAMTLGVVEPAVMALVLAILVLHAAQSAARRG